MKRCPIAGAKEAAERRTEVRRGQDELRRERDKYRRLYSLTAWKNLVIKKLNRNPLCEEFDKDGTPCREAARVVHHLKDHRGDLDLFFDYDNLQALCKSHHDQITARRVNAARLH
jgi:5-methylcytosine-specific restriction protein A